GADFNGILNLLSANTRWDNAGGFYVYDSAFSTSIGGYPKNALLAKLAGDGFWMSTADNNTADPDTGGANWVAFDPLSIQSNIYNHGVDSGAANAYAVALIPSPTALTPGMLISVGSLQFSNTGPSTLNINGLGALPIQSAGSVALQGGELVAGKDAIFQVNKTSAVVNLVYTSGGAMPVAAGSKSEHAVNLGQMQLYVPKIASASTVASNTTTSISVSFTAPCAGVLMAVGNTNYGVSTTGSNVSTLYINGAQVATDNTMTTRAHVGSAITSGGACTAQLTGAASVAFSLWLTLIFVPNVGS
ncbi:MAG: hypothetical protein B7X10_01950, partial [Burkholderiales bacterium 21-58-4]